MESYVIKTNGSWDTLKKISNITEIQIIDPNEFEIAIVFNKHNIEFRDWILDELKEIDGVLNIHSKKELDKYNKVFHIQHYDNSLETLCGINGRLGMKINFCDALRNEQNNICAKCKEILKNIDEVHAINNICENILSYEEE